MKNHNLQSLLFIAGILMAVFFASLLFRAPKPLPVNTSDREFSAFRAFEHTKSIAQKPHSIGIEEHDRVKKYIISELKNLGLSESEQTTTSIYYNKKRGLSAGYIHNIVGILKGTGSDKKVLIVGHYDSQPHTLGAADDGSAVASMLEAARALKKNAPPKNDIVFLFSDGEEADLFGAVAFVKEHQLKDSIGIVLNLEARGNAGPSITYEVSPRNGWLMREYAKAVPYPIAHSVAYEIYKLLPNSTDFTPFKEAGFSGFNVAFIDNFSSYHSMTDSPENISLGSLQHHGSYVMGIAKHFGNLDLTNTKDNDVVYFNWIGFSLVTYPLGYNMFLVIIISLLFICAVSLGVRKNKLSISNILLGSLIYIAAFASIILFTWILQIVVKAIYPYYSNFYSSNFYNVKDYFFAFSCLAVAIFSSIYVLIFKKISVDNLLMGSVFVSYVLMFILLIYIPTGAYLAIIPLLLILLGIVVCYVFDFSLEHKRGAFLLIHLVSLLPIVFLIIPLLEMIFISFGLDTIFAGIAVLTILLGYLIFSMKVFFDRMKWSLPIIALAFLAGELLLGEFSSTFSEKQPLQSNVSYLINEDKNEACWFSQINYIDDWKKQFFTNPETKPLADFIIPLKDEVLQNKAELYHQPLPVLNVTADSMINGSRELNVVISSQRKAEACKVYISKNAGLSNFEINGKKVVNDIFYNDSTSNFYYFNYFGLSEKNLELNLSCHSTEKIEISVIESKLGLPFFEGFKPMPNYIIPDKGFISNVTLVKRTWKL